MAHVAFARIGFWSAAALALCATTSSGEEIHLQARKDNTLYQHPLGALSNGAGTFMFCGRTAQAAGSIRRALIAFDVAGAIPAGSTIDAAKLVVTMDHTISLDQTCGIHLATSDWGEGASLAPGEQGSGAVASPGDATWLHTFFDTSLWTAQGGDFLPGATTTTVIGAPGQYSFSDPAVAADVQGWLDNPASNFGWVIRGNEGASATAKRFATREHADPASRPFLIVVYTPPACYPDCDGNGTLNVNDYICFQTKFALGDPYADCDNNGVRNVNDYICFQTKFALGC